MNILIYIKDEREWRLLLSRYNSFWSLAFLECFSKFNTKISLYLYKFIYDMLMFLISIIKAWKIYLNVVCVIFPRVSVWILQSQSFWYNTSRNGIKGSINLSPTMIYDALVNIHLMLANINRAWNTFRPLKCIKHHELESFRVKL